MRNGAEVVTTSIAVLVAACLLTMVPGLAEAQAFADAKKGLVNYTKADHVPRVSCDSLSAMKLPDLVTLRAREVPAEGAVPAHCRVNGVIAPEVAFEVNLPARWNGRFYMIGNGGHAGDSFDNQGRAAQRAEALQLGFAMAGTNTGHDAAKEPGASFALSNPQKAIDYAYRAVHVSAVAAKDLAKTYYARPVDHSYWNSCSNGGRQGLIEAQRFPDDFDGVVANAPWTDQTGFTIGAMWNQRAVTEAQITPEKMALVAKGVMAKCDAVDGLTDGLIDDPRACRFDPANDVPACSAGASTAECLTAAEAGALSRIYNGVTSNGKPFFPGFMPGSEAVVPGPGGAVASGWVNLIVPRTADAKPADFNLAEGTMKYLVFDPPNASYDFRAFDFDKDPQLLTRWGALANANNPDLSSFRKRGGKVLMTYGWADSILQPMMGVNYYERALEVNGAGTTDFFRLFMIPGMAHCGGGVGPDRHDPMTAIIDWVEKGKAPDTMLASKVVGDKVVRTRPLCVYPQVARYSGKGSIDEAANFRCVAPGR
jgi:feruloyl esterase